MDKKDVLISYHQSFFDRWVHPEVLVSSLRHFRDETLIEINKLSEIVEGKFDCEKWCELRSEFSLISQRLDSLESRISDVNSSDIDKIEEIVNSNIHKDSDKLDKLTDREREVFDLLVEGLKHSEIAERLNIGRSRITAIRYSIEKKIGEISTQTT